MKLGPALLLPLTAILAGCGNGLSPDAPIFGDAMLEALPDDAVLVGSFSDLGDELAALAAGGWVEPDALPLSARPERLVLGCGGAGCLGLVEGEVEPLGRGRRRSSELWTLRAGAVDLRWRRLGSGKAVVGEARAVDALRRVRAQGGPMLDLRPLQGAVPAGDAWLYAGDAERLVSLARARGLDLPELPAEARRLRSLGVAAELDGPRLLLTVRAGLASAAEAEAAALALRHRSLGGLAGRLRDRGRIVAGGPWVELQGAWLELDELAAVGAGAPP